MKGEGETLLASHPPPSTWLLLLQRGPMMVLPSLSAPTTSTNPIPALPQPNRVQVLPPASLQGNMHNCLHCSGKDDSLDNESLHVPALQFYKWGYVIASYKA